MQGLCLAFCFVEGSMFMNFPVYQTGITLQELPNMISFYIQFSECHIQCEGCHSNYLWGTYDNYKSLNWIVDKAKSAREQGADAIILFGDVNNNISPLNYFKLCENLADILPICVYSGADTLVDSLGNLDTLRYIKWIKLGHYSKTAGPLDSKTTNQRIYLVEADGLKDVTRNLF